MNLEHFKLNLEKISQTNEKFTFSIQTGAKQADFDNAEKQLQVNIPNKIKDFFVVHNGFNTNEPCFELLPIDNWMYLAKNKIHFATFDNQIKVYFDTSKLNSANQWTIKTYDTDYAITLTLSSFWSNKIWHWLKFQRKVWQAEFWKP